MRPSRARRKTAVLAIAAALFAAGASLAHAELTQRGDLFVSFSGGLTPGALPRNALAPIAVHIEGKVRTLSGERPPALRQIRIEINRDGRLDTRGLPLCHMRQIEASSNAQALAACGAALVGGGSYLAKTAFPGAVFPFARASMTFADGRTLASTLTRSCRVRG